MNRRTVRLAVVILGAVLLLIVIGAIALAFDGKTPPTFLETAGGTALGAIAALVIPRADEADDEVQAGPFVPPA